MSAGQFGWTPPPRRRLYRDTLNGRVSGVCAGIANYLEVKPKYVRIGVILTAIFVLPSVVPLLIGYILLTLFLPIDPAAPAYRPETAAPSPQDPLSGLLARFRALDDRLAAMERHVTSSEFALRQEFRKL